MAIKIDNKEFLSYEEQVLENKKKLQEIITEVNEKLVEIDDKVKDTLIVNVPIEDELNISLSDVLPNQGELVVGDLVIGTDGWIAKVIGIGATSVDLTPSVPVLDYMNALNVAFEGIGTTYLESIVDVQNALKELDTVAKTTEDTLTSHKDNKGNPHLVTKAQVGLGNVDNTSDMAKPVSTAQGLALGSVSQNIVLHKTDKANPHQVTKVQVGLGNVDNTKDVNKPVSYPQGVAIGEVSTALDEHKDDTDNPHAVTKAHVGLSNVDNTADINKPVSTAQQTELNKKVDKEQEAWITPTLIGGATGTLKYMKDTMGRVWFKGDVRGTGNIFNMPTGYRVGEYSRFMIHIYSSSSKGVRLEVYPNGNLDVLNDTPEALLLITISYKAEA